jgi:hypothetical protein
VCGCGGWQVYVVGLALWCVCVWLWLCGGIQRHVQHQSLSVSLRALENSYLRGVYVCVSLRAHVE